ncbi:hypothetical protein TOPH_03115 [Tolypocladium ophioglossoides CBS 100239]|uniref:Uncharacterized protein n=1 Tax=Tolypocladium ophioglossoides (strain CBS 100239) TaxID=1163406 RepID=A0A0L0NDM0_TOLOC|nr:hypothetical protein TOPH_03115 [Tolypocladium ophioglossoides CBS 100239]
MAAKPRGGRAGRGGKAGGRGHHSGANTTEAKKTSPEPKKDPPRGIRRGRAKSFISSRIQTSYDRSWHIRGFLKTVAKVFVPAAKNLCNRTINGLKADTIRFEHHPDIVARKEELDERLEDAIAQAGRARDRHIELAGQNRDNNIYLAEQEYQNRAEDMMEDYYDGLLNKLTVLDSLHAKGLPVDVRDDRFEYKPIDDAHLDNEFGRYAEYQDGHLVPYPSQVPGTKAHKLYVAARAAIAAEKAAEDAAKKDAAAAKAEAATSKTRAGTPVKRKAQVQPEDQPTPKKVTRASARHAQLLAPGELSHPAPAMGLLAAAQQAAAVTEPATEPVTEANTPAAEEGSVPASPEPESPRMEGGLFSHKEREVLKSAAPSDEYGIRSYSNKPNKETATYFRFFVPRVVEFKPWEIGFKDSTNDPSRVEAKKYNKYTGTPNSNGTHLDHRVVDYDSSTLTPEDLDQDAVERHGLHPSHGFFLATSTNEAEEAEPYVMPGKPVVYLANPSGRMAHASRSFQQTVNQRSADERPLRSQMGLLLRRFCKMADIDSEDVAVTEFVESDEALRAKSIGTAAMETELNVFSQSDATASDAGEEAAAHELPEQADGRISALSILTYATAYEEAREATRATTSASKTSRYDAIRDVFTASKPGPTPVGDDDTLNLNFLAQVCNFERRLPGSTVCANPGHPQAPVLGSDIRSTITQGEALQAAPYGHGQVNPGMTQEPSAVFTHNQPREPAPLQRSGPLHAPNAEPSMYSVLQDPGMQPHQQARPAEFQPHPRIPPGHLMQDHSAYYPPSGYAAPDHRDAHMASSRPVDPGYNNPRGMARYGSEAPPTQAYGNPAYWSPQPQPGPAQIAMPGVAAQHQYPPPPAAVSHSRIPFTHNASAEPLPPLRPSRGRNQSLPDEPMHDAGMRPGMHSGIAAYYPATHSRGYPRSYPEPPHHASQSLGSERILPNPQHQPQAYMGSPPPSGFALQHAPQVLSPTFGNPSAIPSQMAQQSPPGTPHGPPGSAHQHRSTLSGDAGNGKYRKLQPAPVPAHRAWTNKPELRTIFYDHKETGSSAALPNSGPTQIRGWNVNQPRKRSKQDRADSSNDREDSR